MIQRGGIFELFCGARIANFGYGYLLEDVLVPTYVRFAVLRCKMREHDTVLAGTLGVNQEVFEAEMVQ